MNKDRVEPERMTLGPQDILGTTLVSHWDLVSLLPPLTVQLMARVKRRYGINNRAITWVTCRAGPLHQTLHTHLAPSSEKLKKEIQGVGSCHMSGCWPKPTGQPAGRQETHEQGHCLIPRRPDCKRGCRPLPPSRSHADFSCAHP